MSVPSLRDIFIEVVAELHFQEKGVNLIFFAFVTSVMVIRAFSEYTFYVFKLILEFFLSVQPCCGLSSKLEWHSCLFIIREF